jgi:hypothetical protein
VNGIAASVDGAVAVHGTVGACVPIMGDDDDSGLFILMGEAGCVEARMGEEEPSGISTAHRGGDAAKWRLSGDKTGLSGGLSKYAGDFLERYWVFCMGMDLRGSLSALWRLVFPMSLTSQSSPTSKDSR